MRPVILTILFSLFSAAAMGQGGLKSRLKYKPKTLDEAVSQLEKIHDDSTKGKIRTMTEDEFSANSYFGMGMWIRNNWGLWKGGALPDYFNSKGIFHPDDMSGIILTSYYRQLKGQDWELEKQIKYYQDYWKSTSEHFQRFKTDTSYRNKVLQTRDSFELARLNEKKRNWSTGKKVSGYIDRRPGFFEGYGRRAKIEGDIIEWRNEKLTIKIPKFHHEKIKKRLGRRYKILNDTLVVPHHELFGLVGG
jgi:hypothetical protein